MDTVNKTSKCSPVKRGGLMVTLVTLLLWTLRRRNGVSTLQKKEQSPPEPETNKVMVEDIIEKVTASDIPQHPPKTRRPRKQSLVLKVNRQF